MSRRIPRVEGLCPEQIAARGAPDTAAVLIDQFGCAHRLATVTVIGREPGEPGVAVLEASVSRRHAELRLAGGAWSVTDLGSTNGTFLEGARVDGAGARLADGQLLVLGDVGFAFHADGTAAAARTHTASIRATAASPVAADPRRVRLVEPARGGGGFAEHAGDKVQLGATQFALLAALARRHAEETEQPDDVRGYVRSVELLADLPWDTAHPQDNHLKQLVRRTRRALERIGLDDAIESRQRFGYRLCIAADLATD